MQQMLSPLDHIDEGVRVTPSHTIRELAFLQGARFGPSGQNTELPPDELCAHQVAEAR